MKSKRILLLLSFLLLTALAISACNQVDYQPVTFEELTGNTTAYDGKNISITGFYGGEQGPVMCIQLACECNCSEYEMTDTYMHMYGRGYHIIKGNGIRISFIPPDINDDGYVDVLDLEIGQEIELKGAAGSFYIPSPCPCPCSCKLWRTLVFRAHEIQPK
jgi:hypothetical protein